MKQLYGALLIFFLHSGICQFDGAYLRTGGCPNYTPAINIDNDRMTTIWTVVARSRLSTVETRLDCTRVSLILNNPGGNEIVFIVRTQRTDVVRGVQGMLGNAISSDVGYYNILNVLGVPAFYLKGSVWILDTDNETYCILVMCSELLSIGNSHVYVLSRGPIPDNLIQIANAVLLENKLNPRGLIWGLDRNC